jgi:hypothetical protein
VTPWPRWRVARHPGGLSRRAFLGGAAATITLPALVSLLPRGARAEGEGPRRLVVVYGPCGLRMSSWTPQGEGAEWGVSPTLEPVAHLRDRLTVVSGLANRPAMASGAGDHARGTGAFLTCVTPAFERVALATSADQLAARAIGGASVLPSLQLCAERTESSGTCDAAYPCAYESAISWADATTPLPGLSSPAALFDLLFRGSDPRMTPDEQLRRRAHGRSVLDGVVDEIADLGPRLATDDRTRLDAYLTGLRDLERSLALPQGSCLAPTRPAPTSDPTVQIDQLSALVAVALQCDLTRVVTLMLGRGASTRGYPFLGFPGTHHEYSHHGGIPSNLDALDAIDRWELSRVATLLDALDQVVEGEETVLDRTAVLFSSEISDGNEHLHTDLPVLLAGSAGGRLRTGEHVRADDAPLAGLLWSLLEALDAPQDAFGDADGPLEDVLA